MTTIQEANLIAIRISSVTEMSAKEKKNKAEDVFAKMATQSKAFGLDVRSAIQPAVLQRAMELVVHM